MRHSESPRLTTILVTPFCVGRAVGFGAGSLCREMFKISVAVCFLGRSVARMPVWVAAGGVACVDASCPGTAAPVAPGGGGTGSARAASG